MSPRPHAEPLEQPHRARGSLRTRPRSKGNFHHHCNQVYAETHGVGLVMDVFQPLENSNHHAIVDVISGAWHADRARLNEHLGLGAIDALCNAGFTVFAVAPGSATLFSADQMVTHVQAAIRHIRSTATTWDVDTDKLGLCGVSAGGHIAALTALQPHAADPKARLPWYQQATDVAAVGLFFPPSDFLNYGGARFDFQRKSELPIDRLLFAEGLGSPTEAALDHAARAISPRYAITTGHPPFWIAHATEDSIVPFSQSEHFVAALQDAGVDATLHQHDGPGHPWPTIAHECEHLAEWFREKLLP